MKAARTHVRRTLIPFLLIAALAILLVIPNGISAQGSGSDEDPVWSADMLVVEYTEISIGAASADLFSNVGGTGNLQIRSLWSYLPDSDLRLAFTDGVPDADDMTLKVGDLVLKFPAGSSGESSFKWTGIEVDWKDGDTVTVSIVRTSTLTEPEGNIDATGGPTITGTPQVDQTLTADTSSITDEDGLEAVSYEYQWVRSDNGADSDIAGATEATYTLVYADQGKTIKVKVTFTDDAENEEILTSEATGNVTAAPNRAATGDPAISGTPQVNQTLTAGTAAISDEDGLDAVSYEYQWTADDTDIGQATKATYTPSTEDIGKTIKVKVSFTDDRNNDESRTSAATSAVLATVPGQPQSLTVTAGDNIQELAAYWQAPSSNGGADVTGYKVQWKESADSWDTEADVSEATVTGTTYTITGLTGGTAYAVRVIATNSAGDGPASAEAAGTPAGAVSEQTTLGSLSSTTISSIAISSNPGEDKVYAIGDAIKVKVTFSADVTVTGKPQLELDIGGESRAAEHESNAGTEIVFAYTVADGDSDSDGIAISENNLTLNGGAIKDADDSAADLAHGALAADGGHKVDGIRPKVSSFTIGGGNSVHLLGENVPVAVRFTEEIFLDGEPTMTVDVDSGDQTAEFEYIQLPCPVIDGVIDEAETPILTSVVPEGEESTNDPYTCYTSQTQGMKIMFYYTVKEGDLDENGLGLPVNALNLNGGTLRDAAGNDAVITHDAVADKPSVRIDGVPLTITSIEITSDPGEDDTYAAGDTIRFKVTFNERPKMGSLPFPRLRLDMGTQARMAYWTQRNPQDVQEDETGTIFDYAYTVVDGDNDDNGISLPANPLHALRSGLSDVNGNKADLEYDATPDNADHKVATSSTIEAQTGDTEKSGDLTITGTLRTGETVLADFSNVDDEDGVEYAVSTAYFIWAREDSETRLLTRFDARYIIGGVDEGKRLKVSAEFFDDNGNLEYLYSPWTEPVGPSTSSNSDATGTPQGDQTLEVLAPDPDAYVTVVITSGDDTVSWSDPDECTSDYNTYLRISKSNQRSRTHIGSVTSGSTEAAQTISYTWAGNFFTPPSVELELYCGTFDDSSDENDLIASTGIAMWRSSLMEGTYSSAPLTALGISSGTLSPAFDRGIGRYTAEVSNDTEVITLDPTVLTGYQTDFVRNPIWGVVQLCGRGCVYSYGNGTTTGIVLADADEEADGFQINLNRGENRLGIGVNKGSADADAGRLYYVTVTVENSPAVGQPTINGTAQVGETLSADTSGISDADGLDSVNYNYQWLSSRDTEIDQATNSTYKVQPSDNGKVIKVRVTFTDDAGYDESLTSEATEAVTVKSNTVPTGLPTITGTPQVDQTLTADTSSIEDGDGLSNVSYSYQWVRNDNGTDSNIVGETSSTYTLVAADAGRTIKVRVTFTDDADNPESLTSEATVAVAATVPTAPLSLTVTPGDQIQVLDVSWQAPSSNGGSDVTGYKVQWKESADSWDTEADVSEATVTGTSHTITSLTGGVEYSVRVVATNIAGDGPGTTEVRATPTSNPVSGEEGSETVDSDSSAVWNATLTVGVSGSGSEKVWGYNRFVDEMGTLDETTFSEGDQSIEVTGILLANGSVAITVRPHLTTDFVLTVDGTQFASTDASEVKSTTIISYIWPTTLEWAEDDTVELNLTLQDTDSTVTRQQEAIWSATLTVGTTDDFAGYTTFLMSSETNILGALSADTFTSDDESHTVMALGVLEGDLILTVKPKPSSGFVLVAGTTEFASTDASTKATDSLIQYRWADPGLDWSDEEEVAVRMTNGLPTISGTPQVDETLTADTSPIDDVDGLTNVSYEYQWTAGGTDIAGATGSTYKLTGSEQDKTIQVRVTFTDDADNEEILTSEPTVAVAAKPNTAPTGEPTISGTPQVGQTLTVGTSGIADPDGLTNASFGGNWFANDTEGTDATITGGYARAFIVRGADLSYTVSRRDLGKTLKIQVYFTDDAGNDEWLTSAKTSAVVATTPAAPESLVASPTSSGDLSLSWEAPTWDISGEILGDQTWGDGGSPITGYVAQWKEASDSWDSKSDVSEVTVTGTTHTIQALARGTEYTTRVIAVNSVGRGTPSYEATVTTNSPATGAPTISATAQVGQTLTASTSGISDADGLTNVTYSYQWMAGGLDIAGATGSTYELTGSEQGKTIQVRVTFTDDADNEETLTSEATVAVAAKPTPLTATISNVPDSHNGNGITFTFDLAFSENFPLSYITLRDHAFTEDDQGPITKAQRKVQGSNQTWTITVEPRSNGAITITLPATTDCDATGAICTDDGRKLSNSTSITIPGPQ